jgi:hypothetical protein
VSVTEYIAVPIDWRLLIAGAVFCTGTSFFAGALLAYRVLRLPLTWRSAARYAGAGTMALALAIAASSAYAVVAPNQIVVAMVVSLVATQWWIASWHLRHESRRLPTPHESTARLPSWRLAGLVVPATVLINSALSTVFMMWLMAPSMWGVAHDSRVADQWVVASTRGLHGSVAADRSSTRFLAQDNARFGRLAWSSSAARAA